MTCKNIKECGFFHCWKCSKHILLKNAPYCDKCKKLMTNQTTLFEW